MEPRPDPTRIMIGDLIYRRVTADEINYFDGGPETPSQRIDRRLFTTYVPEHLFGITEPHGHISKVRDY